MSKLESIEAGFEFNRGEIFSPEIYNEKDALAIYRHSTDPTFSYKLFHAAGALRDKTLGRDLWWSAGISSVLPCDLEPLCTYCTFFSRNSAAIEDVVAAARVIANLGFRHLHLVGGTRLVEENGTVGGFDDKVIELVQAVRSAVDINLRVNVGPSLTRNGVRSLKELGVAALTSSLEVLNPEIFNRFKPGDSLAERIRLMEICEEEEMPFVSMMLMGLGESDADRIEQLFFLRRFRMLKNLNFSRYMPFPGTTAGGVRCSPWPVARIVAVARLLFPTINIGLAAGNEPDDLALWWLAGGGNQLLGAGASMKDPRGRASVESRAIPVSERIVVHDNTAQISRYMGELGLSVNFSSPCEF